MKRLLNITLALILLVTPACNQMPDFHLTFENLTKISSNYNVLVVRTDFSNPDRWKDIVVEAKAPSVPDGFLAYVDFVSSEAFSDLDTAALISLIESGYGHGFIFICDQRTMNADRPEILVVDLSDEQKRSFRALPSHLQDIENNLSISNMDWEDFSESLDKEGVFTGF